MIKACNDIETSKKLWGTFTENYSKNSVINIADFISKNVHGFNKIEILKFFNQRHINDNLEYNQFLSFLSSHSSNNTFKAKVAFILLKNNQEVIDENSFNKIAKLLIPNDKIIKDIFLRADSSGLGHIIEKDFINFLPKEIEITNNTYSVLHSLDKEMINISNKSSKIKNINNNIDTNDVFGTSPLQLRISLLRLIQGAAYRCFRASFTANSETHLRAYNLPYTISNFVVFLNNILKLYIQSGVPEDEVIKEINKLNDLMDIEYKALVDRINNWKNINKNKAMIEAEEIVENEETKIEDEHDLFLSIIELSLSIGIDGHHHFTIDHTDLAIGETNRLRIQEELKELNKITKTDSKKNKSEIEFIDSWQRVILDDADTHVPGSIMPVRFWYEKFMPQLVKICSATTNDELLFNQNETEEEINDWFNKCKKNNIFDPYALDLNNYFLKNNLEVKKTLKHSWLLSEHYLNGVQKKREREEFGRNDGFLCEYVTFIDIYLGRNDVENSEMRISFPYFIGPSTWRLMHTMGEIACNEQKNNEEFVSIFKDYFRSLASVYPCPYCRYHLNKYVVQNKEIKMYPLEYLFLGFNSNDMDLVISLEDKLNTISKGEDLRLFLWKLHNTVSSSISRSEKWFHKQKNPIYTNRYWPSLDAELEKAHIFNIKLIDVDKVYKVYNLLRPVSKLETLREEVQYALDNNNLQLFNKCKNDFSKVIKELEENIIESNFLQQTYHYNPNLINEAPHFTAEDEMYSRSGYFYEN
jgi:hypothetical protein